MNINQRRKYFLALAQAATTPATTPTAKLVGQAKDTPPANFEAIYSDMRTLWSAPIVEDVKKIIEGLNVAIWVTSNGVTNVNKIRASGFSVDPVVKTGPASQILNFFKSFCDTFVNNPNIKNRRVADKKNLVAEFIRVNATLINNVVSMASENTNKIEDNRFKMLQSLKDLLMSIQNKASLIPEKTR